MGWGMKAYKFLLKSDLRKVFQDHTIRLCSADEVRRAESAKSGFGDRHELAKRWQPGAGGYVLKKDHPVFRSSDLVYPGHDVTFVMQEQTALVMTSSGLMFCASADRSKATTARMKAEFGYDASFEISDFTALAQSIARQLSEGRWWCAEVAYEDIDVTSISVFDRSPFSKPLRFEWQREFRFLCDLTGPSRKVEIPDLRRHVGSVRFH